MPRHNFTATVYFDGRSALASIVPVMKEDGQQYEINIDGFPRFWVRWGALDRYELVRRDDKLIPDSVLLAVSDLIEERDK